MEYHYPVDWVFITPEESIQFGYRGDEPLGMDILDRRAGPHRFFAGGTEILEANFRAEALLGSGFEGKL
jgi:hypothetical protein